MLPPNDFHEKKFKFTGKVMFGEIKALLKDHEGTVMDKLFFNLIKCILQHILLVKTGQRFVKKFNCSNMNIVMEGI